MSKPLVDLSAYPSHKAYKSQKYEKALELLEEDLRTCEVDKERVMLTFMKGNALFWLGRYREAIPVYQEVLDEVERWGNVDEMMYHANNNIGNCYYILGIYDLAIKYMQDALEMKPINVTNYAQLYYNLYNYLDEDSKNELFERIKMIISKSASELDLLYFAYILYQRKEYNLARKYLVKLLSSPVLGVKYQSSALMLNISMEINDKEMVDELVNYSKSIVLKKTNRGVLGENALALALMRYYLKNGKYGDAREIFNRKKKIFNNNEVREANILLREFLPDIARSASVKLSKSFHGMVGYSAAIIDLYKTIQNISTSEKVNMLIVGETGTGKELVARSVHNISNRKAKQFIAVNVPGLPSQLFETEFFGHVKGAFTGANSNHRGYVQRADGGTLFLDEIFDMPPEMQPKLLRFLDSGEYTPVGSEKILKADVRILCATNRPVEEFLESGRFRRDLYYRLAQYTLKVPSLAERREDIPHLVRYFLNKYNALNGTALKITKPAIDLFRKLDYPGNIRQLQNMVFAACAGASVQVGVEDILRLPEVEGLEIIAENRQTGVSPDIPAGTPLRVQVQRFEGEVIRRTLEEEGGNAAAAARRLGISRSTLLRKLNMSPVNRKGEVSHED